MSDFASGRHAKAICDICGVRCDYTELKEVMRAGLPTNLLACNYCWDKDHPQLFLGRKPVRDRQALRRPRPDNSNADGRAYFDKAKIMMPPVSVLLNKPIVSLWNVTGGTGGYGVDSNPPIPGAVVNSFTEDFNTGNHRISQRRTIVANSNISVSINIKASPNPSPFFAIRMESDDVVTGQYTDVYQWTAGVLAFAGVGSIQGTGTFVSRNLTDLGNGWWNVQNTFNLGSGLTIANVHCHARGLVSTDYVAEGRIAFYYTDEPVIS